MLPETEYPPDYWADLDDDTDDYLPCCICSCLIGDEVEFGQADYFVTGDVVCKQCLEAPGVPDAAT